MADAEHVVLLESRFHQWLNSHVTKLLAQQLRSLSIPPAPLGRLRGMPNVIRLSPKDCLSLHHKTVSAPDCAQNVLNARVIPQDVLVLWRFFVCGSFVKLTPAWPLLPVHLAVRFIHYALCMACALLQTQHRKRFNRFRLELPFRRCRPKSDRQTDSELAPAAIPHTMLAMKFGRNRQRQTFMELWSYRCSCLGEKLFAIPSASQIRKKKKILAEVTSQTWLL
jgi:hypothetical protein